MVAIFFSNKQHASIEDLDKYFCFEVNASDAYISRVWALNSQSTCEYSQNV